MRTDLTNERVFDAIRTTPDLFEAMLALSIDAHDGGDLRQFVLALGRLEEAGRVRLEVTGR